MEENLARQAELALERQGDHDWLFYEGRWHSSGSLADRRDDREVQGKLDRKKLREWIKG